MKKNLFILLCLTAMAMLGELNAQGLFGPNHNSTLRQGLLDYKKGKYEDALLKYNQVFKLKQNDPLVNYNLGTILYKKGNFDTAAYFFDNAIKYVQDPVLKSKAYYNMGNAYMQQKKYDKATESYINSLKYNPADPDSRYNLTYALRNLKQQKQQQKQQQQNQQQQQQDQNQQQPKEQKMDQNKAHELINSLNNKEQEQNKKIQGQGGNIKSKDW
jgi:Ca-activated chloride channel family protein